MKTTGNTMKVAVLTSLVAVGIVATMMRGKVEQGPSKEETSQVEEVATAEVSKEVKAPVGVKVVTGEEAPVVENQNTEAVVVAQLKADEVELAYQLGQDITELTAEGRARLKVEWEAHVQQTQQEQASVE
jgi:hypothetical protein